MLKDLNMEIRTKLALCILMGMSIFAMVACVVKTIELQVLGTRDDFTWHASAFVIWFTVENYVVIIAASIPTLRPLALKLFRCLRDRTSASRQQAGSTDKTPPPAYGHADSWGSRVSRPRPIRLSSNRHAAKVEVEPPYVHPKQRSPPPPGTIRKTISIYVRADDGEDIEFQHLGSGVHTRISSGGRTQDTSRYGDGWKRTGAGASGGKATQPQQLPVESESRKQLLSARESEESRGDGDRDLERQ
jgi:hypothetical protein